jgi:general secretion pathway protein A
MYCAFYGLQERPFSITPDPRFLFLSQSHQEALGHLLYGIEERRGFITITGEVGTGKTLLCRALLGRLGHQVRTALILNSFMSDLELLRSINEDFGIPAQGTTRKELIDTLNDFLLEEFRDGRNAVLIIDEAQNLAPAVLEQIRMLSNLETERGKLLQIILVGQPELQQQLARADLRQLNQRIALRYHIQPFDRQETADYIHHRLLVAGSHGDVRFSRRALSLIYRHSEGIPRRINLLCDRALLLGYVQGSSGIDQHIVRRANAELKGDQGRRLSRSRWALPRPGFLIALGVIVGLTLTIGGETWLGYYRPESPEISSPIPVTTPEETTATSPAAQPPGSVTAAAVQLANLPATAPDGTPTPLQRDTAEFVADTQTEANEPKKAPAVSPSPGPVRLNSQSQPAFGEVLLRALLQTEANRPQKAPAASPLQGSPNPNSQSHPALEGELLLRALLWEYTRALPPSGEGAKATLAKVASSFGLEMIPIRAELDRLKRFRVACLVEMLAPTPPDPAYIILHGVSPEGVELTDALGDIRQVADAEFARLWSGRAYLFRRSGMDVKNILARGSQGSEVWNLQKRLGELGYFGGEPTGIFDGETVEAVRRLQSDHALQVDGAVGPATKIVLYHVSGQALAKARQP